MRAVIVIAILQEETVEEEEDEDEDEEEEEAAVSSDAEMFHCPVSCCANAQRIALFTLVSCSTLGRPLLCSVLCKH